MCDLVSTVTHNYFTDYLMRVAKERDIEGFGLLTNSELDEAGRRDKEPTLTELYPGIFARSRSLVDTDVGDSVYPGGLQANAAKWELFLCSTEHSRRKAMEDGIVYSYEE
ncbi:hypothetical protein BJ170DRAFT_596623 [Xylariales sp. AK1849]|nr:hypothetical protein BJ170DRAFT_596623 [Xylariales sp. AK1849]